MTQTIETPAVNLQHPRKIWPFIDWPVFDLRGIMIPAMKWLKLKRFLAIHWWHCGWCCFLTARQLQVRFLVYRAFVCACVVSLLVYLSLPLHKGLHLGLIDNCAISWSLVQSGALPLSWVCWVRVRVWVRDSIRDGRDGSWSLSARG